MNTFPRRCNVDKLTPTELKIREAITAVEAVWASVELTKISTMLSDANNLLADYLESNNLI